MNNTDLNSSQTSISSTIVQLPSKYEIVSTPSSSSTSSPPPPIEFYSFSIRLDSYQNIVNLIQSYSNNETTFWFSWNLLDIAIQTAEFNIHNPESANDSITIQCSAPALAKFLMDLPSIRIYLCMTNKILTYIEVPIPRDIIIPLQFSGWFPLIPPQTDINKNNYNNNNSDTLVHVTLDVRKSTPTTNPTSPEKQKKKTTNGHNNNSNNNNNTMSTMDQNIQTSQDINDNDNDDDDDENYDDDFNDDEVHGDDHGNNNNIHNNNINNNNNNNNNNNKNEFLDSEYDTKRYRLSFQIRSIRALKRAAHISLQFAYPHLGVSSSPIRTHGSWCLAHSDTLIEGATVSYEFQMIFSQLLMILQQNKLVVNVISRNQLGSDRIGDATIDLNSLHTNKTVNILYRCSLTGKQFKSLDQYKRHRQTMIALYTLGRINEVPSKSPIIIRSLEVFASILGKSTSSNGNPDVIGKLRCILILEQLGTIGPSSLSSSGGGGLSSNQLLMTEENVFKNDENQMNALLPPPPPPPLPPTIEEEEVLRRLDWEEWRRKEEEKWMNSLREKEIKLRQKLEEEMSATLSQKADDLKRAQEEVGRLEVRLRTSIDSIEKQKLQLQMKEEQMNLRLGQKTEELNLLQKRIREEGKNKIEQEIRKNKTLENQIKLLEESLQRTEKRALEAEKDYDTYRQYIRSVPETQLREELSKQKSLVSELRNEIEREKRMKTEMELEKEHYRSQVQRVALALKREREKNGVMARQELEQLRLEFLAREERYVLDGDREELRMIREELSHLRNVNPNPSNNNDGDYHQNNNKVVVPIQSRSYPNQIQSPMMKMPPSQYDPRESIPLSLPISSSLHQLMKGDQNQNQIEKLKQMKNDLLQSKLYHPSDTIIQEIDEAIYQQQIITTKKVDGILEQK